MSAIATKTKPKSRKRSTSRKPAVLRTPDEADAYIRKHLKPAGYSPSGLPFYRYEDLKKLDIRFKW